MASSLLEGMKSLAGRRECKSAISKRSNRLRLKAYIGSTVMPPSGLSGATFLGIPTT